jgi:hypothetical protein
MDLLESCLASQVEELSSHGSEKLPRISASISVTGVSANKNSGLASSIVVLLGNGRSRTE